MIQTAKRLEIVEEYYFSFKLREVRQLISEGKPIINMGIGSPDLAPSERVIEALKNAITQWGNLGGLIAGLYTKDYELIGRSLNDVIVEPARKHLIPNFDNVKNGAMQSGALGSGISGAGPSIFALCKGETSAKTVAQSMSDAYADTGIPFDIHISKVNDEGTKIL